MSGLQRLFEVATARVSSPRWGLGGQPHGFCTLDPLRDWHRLVWGSCLVDSRPPSAGGEFLRLDRTTLWARGAGQSVRNPGTPWEFPMGGETH